jgi:tetratricopeptide (TPR) repeat protein
MNRKVAAIVRESPFYPVSYGKAAAGWTLFGVIVMACLLSSGYSWAVDDTAIYVPYLDTADQYWETIERIESESSPYSSELADLYLSLGRSLLENEKLDEARDALQRGIQVIRVNYGLHAAEQADFLYTIADIAGKLGGREEAEKVVEQIRFISEKSYAEDYEHLLPALERIYDWYSVHRSLDLPTSRYEDMERFNTLAQEMARINEEQKGFNHPDTAASYRTVGQVHYKTVDYFLGSDTKYEPEVVVFTGISAPKQKNKPVSVKDIFKTGTEAMIKFTESVAQAENLGPLEQAEAFAQLGEWYFMIEKRNDADESFRLAYQILLHNEATSQMAGAYFAQPVPARILAQTDELTGDPGQNAAYGVLRVSMNISRAGEVYGVEVLDYPESMDKKQVRALVQEIRRQRFRPRLVDGQPQKTMDFVWNHAIEPPEIDPEN